MLLWLTINYEYFIYITSWHIFSYNTSRPLHLIPMTTKNPWSEFESKNPLKDIQDFHNNLRDRPLNDESFALPTCIVSKIENLERIWKEGQKK